MRVEFVGQSRKDSDNPTSATSELVNCYREAYEGGFVLKPVLGTVAWAETGQVFVDAMGTVDGSLFVVSGGRLFRITRGGTAQDRGAVGSGRASLCGNNGDVCVAADGQYRVWDGATLTSPTTGAFSDVGSVAFIGQRTVVTERNGRRFGWSALADGKTFSALDFATAEGRDDNIIRAMAINGFLWLFKEASIEVWHPTATGFLRVPGAVIETGLKDFGLVTATPNGAFMVGADGIAYRTSGAGLEPTSFPAVETDIAAGTPTDCFYYEDEGHKCSVIRFHDRASWVFDASMGEWHRRASGVEHDPWTARAAVKAYGHWVIGETGGTLRRLARVGADAGEPLKRTARSRTLDGEAVVSLFEMFANVGQFADAPEVMLRFSRDRGRTWGDVKRKTLGVIGAYRQRVEHRALGWGRHFTAEVSVTDAADVQIEARAEVA